MFAALREHVFFILVLVIAVPATFHYSIAPIWRAHRELRNQLPASEPGSRRLRVVLPLSLGVVVGWAALPMLLEPILLVAISQVSHPK